jgi:acetyltransferase
VTRAGELAPFFAPRSVAVVGASRNPAKVGGSVLANLRAAGFEGRIVPVNPAAGSVQGLPAVPSLRAAEAPVDLAVIAVPAPAVLAALEDCAAADVKAAVVITAGFREAGEAGRAREAALRAWRAGRPLRLIGPNCLGWIRPSRRLNATFAAGMPLPGGIAFVSHSGALAAAILDWARDRRLGFSFFASLGNQADLNESDLLLAAADDGETRVVAAYIEGVADGRRFVEALGATAARKPVVLLKGGRSAGGARAVASHTGALAGSDAAFDAAVRHAGAVRVRSVEELFDLARCLATQPLPRGRRLLVVTNGGGMGIVATDAAQEAMLEVAPLAPAVQARLAAELPTTASLANPVDLVGDADAARYDHALRAVGPDGGVDLALVIMTAQAASDAAAVARAILGATRGWPIPVAAAFVGGARVAPGARTLEEAGLPCYAFPEPAVTALAGLALVAERRGQRGEPPPSGPPADRIASLRAGLAHGARRPGTLGLGELEPLLRAYGIPLLPTLKAATPAAAGEAAQRVGFPVALKVASPDIAHKTEVGGVRLDLRSAAEVTAAAEAMLAGVRAARPGATVRGFTVQAMAAPGKELLVGALRDPQFGPLVMVGLGGVYVEILRDTATRLAPLGPGDAARMLDELRAAPLLRGVRGEPPVARDAVVDAITRLARLAADCPELEELELNPLVARPDGAVAVDARARLAAPPGAAPGAAAT